MASHHQGRRDGPRLAPRIHVDAAVAGGGEVVRRWFVVVQFCARGIWREFWHEGQGYAFRLRRDAEREADEARKRYTNPQRWHVSVARRRVKE